MSDAEDVLDRLQHRYAAQCNEDREHERGLKTATLDNPGWTVTIDLEETDLEQHEYPRQDANRSAHDRVRARTSEKTFHTGCGPGNLTEALALFRSWATANTP
ncbi:immunity 53 family protein [Streptomyces bobili]|uniref:immunity 53 family protein n=1 Tax=Streptomyces bobili TaxID=67280 RepID=UPI002257C78C|nr:immunity 53 family protein [Streptomyces bobili]MCX5528944.1 immunity 53 family protein [Streptomyces bobili]